MAINATFTFTPALPSGSITVVGDTETEIKTKVLQTLATRKATSQGQVAALETAEAGMNG